MQYRRAFVSGGCYFFTVVTANRRRLLAGPPMIDLLRDAFRHVRQRHPFTIEAMVVLPDHLHCVWTLPPEDPDFATRWRLIKSRLTRQSGIRNQQVWQGRYWEHLIRSDADYGHHLDYIHYNPVKHGYVRSPRDWPYSSFHKFIGKGIYPADWGDSEPRMPAGVGRE